MLVESLQWSKPLRTRIAPTPSGFLHIGNAYSFVLTWLWSQLHQAELLLRIDDADQQRIRPEYLEDIFYSLDFLGIVPSCGPSSVQEFLDKFSQTYREDLYQHAISLLKQQNALFPCRCSRKQLQQNKLCTCLESPPQAESEQQTAWKLDTAQALALELRDWQAGTHHLHLHHLAPYPSIQKRDGKAAYQLSSVIDDDFWGVNVIIRGADLWASTGIQLHLANLLGKTEFQHALFYHHPLILSLNGEKLSKSKGDTSLHAYRQSASAAPIFRQIATFLQLPSAEKITNGQTLLDAAHTLEWPKIF
ncbi:MAG: hypothetical protein EAZ57_05650 [Cytophagales bacterium]|nr:MAG: hypothetical protein EAZ67_06555 [Cytophagales bacterium]TAF60838.1 MAG: hypothetical protein EAZ57_05650 [Cytophagales bacterium]